MTRTDAQIAREWAEKVVVREKITFSVDDETLAAARHILAADTLEYRVEHQHIENGVWHPVTQWSPEWPFHEGHCKADDERVVCRRVSAPWEVADE